MKPSLDNAQEIEPRIGHGDGRVSPYAGMISVLLFAGLLSFGAATTVLAGKPVKPPKPPPEAAPVYDCVRLGTWVAGSYATDINAAGWIVGQATSELDPDLYPMKEEPFLVIPLTFPDGSRIWNVGGAQNELMIPLGIPPNVPDVPGISAYPISMTDDGLILGRTYHPPGITIYWVLGPVFMDNNLIWNVPLPDGGNALMQPLEFTAPGSEVEGYAYDVNRDGILCGSLSSGMGFVLPPRNFAVLETGEVVADHSYIDENGDGLNDLLVDVGQMFNDAGMLVPLNPSAINSSGQLAGSVGGHAWVLSPETVVVDGQSILLWHRDTDGDGENDLVQRLPLDGGITDDKAVAISESGNVTGHVESKKGSLIAAWLLDSATGEYTFVNIGKVPREEHPKAADINDEGQVVGYSYTANWRIGYHSTGFLWEDGSMYTVPEIFPNEDGISEASTRLWAINNDGLLVGTDGEAFLAVPIVP